jgi:hypothetical protein
VTYQGLWWNSPAGSESGWGLNIAHQGDTLFATWFTYDADGNGMWLVMPGATLSTSMNDDGGCDYYGYCMPMMSMPSYSGTVYRTTGPAFDAATFDPAGVNVVAVGNATMRFTGSDDGTFSYTVNGVSQMKNIVRQVFGPMPQCSLGGSEGSAPNYGDLWWRSPAGSESGWGVNLTHQGDTLFATWFTYDANHRGLWLVMSNGQKTAPGTYTGTLYRTTGPRFDSAQWTGSSVVASPVGTATFAFTDANNGTFTTTMNGKTMAKAITRQSFGVPATICR